MSEYVPLEVFAEYKKIGLELGFKNVYSGTFVRSSCNSEEIYDGEDI